ncbi:MAG: helix-turn-helix domain-containing protein [Zoogloea sp.]|nr:helix-turn-helix domain-containing protein [Zoogloea sp.]
MRRVKALDFPDDPLLQEVRNLASFIRAARTQSGLTLEEAALATGVAKSTMQSIETNPSKVAFETLLYVARQLGVSIFAYPSEQQEMVRKLTQNLGSNPLGRRLHKP